MTTRLFDTGIFDSGIFKTDEPIPGIFDTGIYDTGIFDHRVTPSVVPQSTGGWEWLNSLNPPSRRREEPEEKPEPRRRRLKADTIELAPDLEVVTGVIPSMPAWDMMAELQRRQAEAEAARLARLRAIALADDDWLMMA
jgi:hypothetical protein